MNARTISLCLAALLASSTARAEMPRSGQVYRGPKKFSSPEQGLAFTLPRGAAGRLDGEYFAIVDPADQGRSGIVLLWSSKGKLADAKRLMNQAIPIGGGVTLRPKTKVRARGSTLSASYSVSGGGALTEAKITAKVAHGSIVAVVSGYAPASKEKFARLGRLISSSIRISKPKTARAAGATKSGEWHRWLAGARLTRFYSGSGYSEKESYTFCADGTFYRSFGATSVGGVGTGAKRAKDQGRWSVSGKGNKGVIVLKFASGSVDRSPVAYRGGKTYWGGTRYFYEANKCQ